jgi:hypothetical protein
MRATTLAGFPGRRSVVLSRKGGLSLLGIALGLLACEIVIRVGFPASLNRFKTYRHMESERGKFCQYDAVLGWSGIPNAEGTLEWRDVRYHAKQNALGFRGPLYESDPTQGAWRIAVLGDSFVWGFGVEDEEVFTRMMEKLSPTRLEVANMGVSGYGTDQEYLLWSSRGHQFNARDVVLAVTITNDFFDNLSSERYGYEKPVYAFGPDGQLHLTNVPVPRRAGPWQVPSERFHSAETVLSRLASSSGTLSLTLDALSRNASFRTYLEEEEVMPRRIPGYDPEVVLYRNPNSSVARGWDVLFGLIHMLNGDVRRQQARLVVVLIPGIAQVYPDLWREFEARVPRIGLEHLDAEAPNRLISDQLRAKGISVIDLLPAFREAGRRNSYLYFPVNGHWTREGHRLAAETLLREFANARVTVAQVLGEGAQDQMTPQKPPQH